MLHTAEEVKSMMPSHCPKLTVDEIISKDIMPYIIKAAKEDKSSVKLLTLKFSPWFISDISWRLENLGYTVKKESDISLIIKWNK